MFGNLLAFVLLIGPLILFHELGHLVVAKLLDVKVNRFSIGFGPALLRKRIGETEYCIAPIPLGGYVSMLGAAGEDVPPGEADRALHAKPLWARYLVYLAGPAANLVLPIAVYFLYFVINQTTVMPALIGTVIDGSAADQAGLQQGDRIVAIDGRDVRSWTEMRKRVERAPGQELELQIDRDGKRLDRVVTPSKTVTRNALGATEVKGRLGVLSNLFYTPQIGIIDLSSPAYENGLRTGDVITSINGEPVRTIEELEQMVEVSGEGLVRLTYLRGEPVATHHANFLWYESHHAQLLPPSSGAPGIGILPASTFVRAVDPGSPAALAGIRPGDRILSAAGSPLTQWVILNDIFGRNRDTPVAFEVQSPGEPPRALEIQLGTRTWKDIYQHEQTEYWFGAHPFDKAFISERESVRGRATYALSSAVDETGAAISIIWSALLQMLTFETGVEGLSSVLGLYSVAGTAYDQGPSNFLLLVAFLSINLGIINLLPIPVLDGGHLLFFTIEAVRRRPLSQRAREISSAIGLVIILLLLLVATRNDIIRYWL